MDYINFEITNFKGIEHIIIDLDRHPRGSVFTLVGLNESGKTTVLEAISYFNKKDKHLESLYDEELRHGDVNDLVPLKKKANFNGTIEIKASISFDSADRSEIEKYAFKNFAYRLNADKLGNKFTLTKKLIFEKSIYKSSQTTWEIDLYGRPSKKRSDGRMYNQDKETWNKMVSFVGERLPSILYFPTFLFEFPSKIYLHKDDEETVTNAYYRAIVQDILDSLNDDLVIEEHIVERALDGSHVKRRSLDTVLNKMGNIVTKTVFDRWNEVFDRRIPQKDIRINCEVEKGTVPKVYLEFQIKDG